ncbi:PLP-dependent aminotransferase family protein [Clostridium sp. chh4-2]|uniref:aminotransferase-like domain-containing protein n=1 Tax=Clostridium sp. chh4-2 TaxID=2067550 RepID=UPI000CCE1922|nr:PLP-dependent aminotransferase family protein [Clostridium sp. chh4-2]PNV62664.1 PLP-dependent aminotransferase family protein [Clostridium sp. chh4-2]
MDYQFSDRINAVKPSSADNILKLMGTPGLKKFSGGNPAAEAFQVETIKGISRRMLEHDPIGILQYSVTEGCPELLQAAKEFLNRKEIKVSTKDQIIITSGSAQIMDLLSKVLCNDNDRVLVEAPTLMVAMSAFRSNGAIVEGVTLEEDGVNLEELEQKLAAKPTPKLFYVIPDFQNPTGVTTSFEKRKAIYELCAKYGTIILEDNPYGELRFAGEEVPSIKSLDKEGIVVYAGSFSKIIAPGIRVAAMSAPVPIAQKVAKAKMLNDVHSTVWSQKICAEILTNCNMDYYVGKLRAIYGKKSRIMLDAIKAYFPQEVSYITPEGGMFLWVTLPDSIDMSEFVKKALDRTVALVPGDVFYPDSEAPCHSFRMNFSTPEELEIVEGIKILGKLMKEELGLTE